ncbi:MAG: bifunctional phosphoglucose/phosphomannose isomerase [Chloroflexota bacterium]|nr:bifunctional phosphoglucose/phosphomannose isomerase [Chloroflexota bacterium]
MIDLDELKVYGKLDPTNMYERIADLPQQCWQAWRSAINIPLPPEFSEVDKVVILGMGGSAIGGDLMRSLVHNNDKIQIIVQRDYHLPRMVDERTLVIASSYSGNTEETISAFSQAIDLPCRKFVITTGGRLSDMAAHNSVPLFSFGYNAEPRAALGYSLFALLAFMQTIGFISAGALDIEETMGLLESFAKKLDREIPIDKNPGKQLALKLHEHLVVIYGAGILSRVADRWKAQINENSKAWAFAEYFPELNHNSVVGYKNPAWLAEKTFIVMLRSPDLHPHVLKRYDITGELLDQANVPHMTFDAKGKSPLSQIMSLIFFGDYVSYYLALLNEVDPSQVESIDYLKKKLSSLETQ